MLTEVKAALSYNIHHLRVVSASGKWKQEHYGIEM